MSYRDDRQALAAQNEQLQAELRSAREEIVRLRGGGVPSNRWLGGPTRIEIERRLDGELSESAIEDLVGVLRSRFGGLGRVEHLGRTISWHTDLDRRGGGRNVAVHFRMGEGTVRIRIEERIGQLAGGLFGGIVGGAGGAGFVNLLVWGLMLVNVWLLLGAVAWVTLVFAIVRRAFGAVARRRARELERVASELDDAARDAIARAKRGKMRVGDQNREPESEIGTNENERSDLGRNRRS